MGNILPSPFGIECALWILVFTPSVTAWNDHYDKEDDAWVMKIFFPIIAALILICVGSCGYANYCKPPTLVGEDDDEVDRAEDVYTLNKPDRPYLTPHYQRRTFQPPPPAYDNHGFRPTLPAFKGPSQITQPSSNYMGHTPAGPMGGMRGQQFGQQNAFTNSYAQFNPQANYQSQNAIKPNPMRSYSFQVPQNNSNYGQIDAVDRSKSLWDVNGGGNGREMQKPESNYNTGRASPIQSTRSAPASYNASGLRRTYSSPNLTPSGSNGSFGKQGGFGAGQIDDGNYNQFNNQFGNHRHSMRNYQQRTHSPASSDSTYIPAASEVGSTAPLFGRRRSPGGAQHQNVYETHNPMSSSRSQAGGSVYGGGNYQDFSQPRRPYEMEDIYGGGSARGNGMSRYGFQNQQPPQVNHFSNQFQTNSNHFTNQYQPPNNYQQQQPQHHQPQQQQQQHVFNPHNPYNPYEFGGQQPQIPEPPQPVAGGPSGAANSAFSNRYVPPQAAQDPASLYEHLTPSQPENYDNYERNGGNYAYDPYNDNGYGG